MASSAPLSSLTLGATSVTDDLGYVALSDLARALGDIAEDYRVIGGHMVTMLVARWQLGPSLHRETGDVDLGIPPVIARDQHLVDRLKDLKYEQVAGNRFARKLADIPAGMMGENSSGSQETFIDVLIPAYTSRAHENVRVGDGLFTTEVLGLQLALARPAVTMALTLHRLNGQALQCELPFADELSACAASGFRHCHESKRGRGTSASLPTSRSVRAVIGRVVTDVIGRCSRGIRSALS